MPQSYLTWVSPELKHISFSLTMNLNHLQTFINAELTLQDQLDGHATCRVARSPPLRRALAQFNALLLLS